MPTIRITRDAIERYRRESQEPAGDWTATVSDLDICETCSYRADIHFHVTMEWENGAKRVEPLPLSRNEKRAWLVAYRPDLLSEWETGDDWV